MADYRTRAVEASGYIDDANSSTTALSGGGSYTGTSQVYGEFEITLYKN